MNRREFAGLGALAPMLAAAAKLKGNSAGKPSLLLPERARRYDIGQGEARVLAGAQESDGRWWLAEIRSDPARKTSLHVHMRADEYVYVLSGVVSAWVEGAWHDLPAAAVAILPRGAPHALGNRSESPMLYLASGSPAGFEGFFPDIEATARRFPYGSPEFLAELAKVYAKYDSKLLAPPPAG